MEETKSLFWRSFLRAIETEPRTATEILGASGFRHPVLAVGVDEARSRMAIVSGDPDARTAALAQADIQAAIPALKVVMARPVAINLQTLAAAAVSRFGSVRVPFAVMDSTAQEEGRAALADVLRPHVDAVMRPFNHVSLNAVSLWKEVIQQLSLVDAEGFGPPQDPTEAKRDIAFMLSRLLAFDPVGIDRRGGVCAVPLYELREEDFETFAKESIDEVRDILRTHDVFQYFFPPADQLALAAADKGVPVSTAAVLRQVLLAPDAGHPFSTNELVDPQAGVTDLVEALGERGLLVEGNASVEVSPTGRSVRAEIKFRPREGVMEKLSRLLSIKIDLSLKDIFK